jgi:hypothetical protein
MSKSQKSYNRNHRIKTVQFFFLETTTPPRLLLPPTGSGAALSKIASLDGSTPNPIFDVHKNLDTDD